MGFLKKDQEGGSPDKKEGGFLANLPFLQKPEPEWDDGTDDTGPSIEESKKKVLFIVMSVYGAVTGFFACQYCKYMHQVFACRAWGVELTSRPIKSYGVPNMVADIIFTFIMYALVGAVGILLNRIMKHVMADADIDNNIFNEGLGYGLFCLVLVSLLMLFIPFNVFLIGIP